MAKAVFQTLPRTWPDLTYQILNWAWEAIAKPGLQIEGILYAFKMPKMHWRLCRGLQICFYKKEKMFFCENDHPDTDSIIKLIMREYDSKCLKMYLITLKVSYLYYLKSKIC
jgi:hypothetical protein